jgi:hypothetical protein
MSHVGRSDGAGTINVHGTEGLQGLITWSNHESIVGMVQKMAI